MGKDDFRSEHLTDEVFSPPHKRGQQSKTASGFSPHLKEMAGRLQKLSFREMGQLADLVLGRLVRGELLNMSTIVTHIDIGEALLDVADQIGGEL